MSRMVGAALNPDVKVEIEFSHNLEPSSGLEMGLGTQPTPPPHSPLGIEITTSDISSFAGISGLVSTSVVYRWFYLIYIRRYN